MAVAPRRVLAAAINGRCWGERVLSCAGMGGPERGEGLHTPPKSLAVSAEPLLLLLGGWGPLCVFLSDMLDFPQTTRGCWGGRGCTKRLFWANRGHGDGHSPGHPPRAPALGGGVGQAMRCRLAPAAAAAAGLSFG